MLIAAATGVATTGTATTGAATTAVASRLKWSCNPAAANIGQENYALRHLSMFGWVRVSQKLRHRLRFARAPRSAHRKLSSQGSSIR
eukprot:3314782-Pleurochrysis_carterae.AAC.1